MSVILLLTYEWYLCQSECLFVDVLMFNGPISQIPKCAWPVFHKTLHWNRNVHISVPVWCIVAVGYGTGVLWDLWDWNITKKNNNINHWKFHSNERACTLQHYKLCMICKKLKPFAPSCHNSDAYTLACSNTRILNTFKTGHYLFSQILYIIISTDLFTLISQVDHQK